MSTLRSLSRGLCLSSLLVAAAAACSSSSSTNKGEDEVRSAYGPKMCVALRGNGNYIITHFTSLARITENYGVADGMAGGSSSTVTMFVYESILKNPDLRTCAGKPCTKDETAARVALLLKSAKEYGVAVGVSNAILGSGGVAELVAAVKKEGIEGLAKVNAEDAAKKLRVVFSEAEAKRLGVLINPELIKMLQVTDPKLLAYNVNEIQESIKTFGAFSVDNNRLFFRPGVVDFAAAAGTTFARAGDFYAGYGPSDHVKMGHFLDVCAPPAKGLMWNDTKDDVSRLPIDNTTCAKYFADMAGTYLGALPTASAFTSRIDEPIGGTLNAIAATSVLTGPAITAYNDALTLYRSGTIASPGQIPFDIKFADVKFGYWGSNATLTRLLKNEKGYTDLKTSKAVSLGTSKWREVLSHSPAEPGLARLGELPDKRLSAGGWPDLAPVLALKNIGCDKVIYVTRRRPESPFATGIANQLGMKAEEGQLYDLGNKESSFTRSLTEASGVWCTDWNSFTDFQIDEMAADSYKAPLETTDKFLSGPSNVVASTNQPGCTPGVK